MKYIEYVRTHFKDPKSPVFTLSELRTVLKLKGISNPYLKRLVNYLIKRGELKRITRGVYTFHDDIAVIGFAFKPFYYGLENALTLRKLWEQGTNPVVITPRSVRSGLREFKNANYVVQKIDKRMFFGVELIRYYDFWVPVSDSEKTLIDFVYFKHYIRPDVLQKLKRKIDKKKLAAYLKACKQGLRNRVEAELRQG